MWQGLQTITNYKGKPSRELPTDTSLLDKLNAFYACFELSVHNTIVFSKHINEQRSLGLNISLYNWILDFLTGHPQVVKVSNNTSSILNILNTGATQGCVLSLFLYSLFTHDSVTSHNSNTIIKFDTTVVGLITNNNETPFRDKLKTALHHPVRCALLGFSAASTSLPQGCLWVNTANLASGGDRNHGQVEIFSLNRSTPHTVKPIQLGLPVLFLDHMMEPCPTEEEEDSDAAAKNTASSGNTICVGLQDGGIRVYFSVETATQCLLTFFHPDSCPVLCLKHSASVLFAGLGNGKVAVYTRKSGGETANQLYNHTVISYITAIFSYNQGNQLQVTKKHKNEQDGSIAMSIGQRTNTR
ncbi:uncharacterized protein [Salvelinus alpinus]|uniref:uncharacterized protein n=1 Tax=Salvelinus alpinus TaxID=8036 RepID=UPI0039FC0325